MRSNAYIIRVDRDYTPEQPSTHGYYVRLMMHLKKGRIDKFFGDVTHGGKRAALAAAKVFRDNAIKTLPKRYTDGRHGPRGVVFGKGVIRTTRKRNGNVYDFYLAYYTAFGVRHAKTWSVLKYGVADAERRAKAWRVEQTAYLIKR